MTLISDNLLISDSRHKRISAAEHGMKIKYLEKIKGTAVQSFFDAQLLNNACFHDEKALEKERFGGDRRMAERENKQQKIEAEEHADERIEKNGQLTLDKNAQKHNIHLLTIIGEVEGHDNLSNNSKTTKYEHILPQLAAIEDSNEIQGVLVLLNTMGGDVEAGLAIAEMLSSLSKPTVSLVLGGSHSIGVPIAVSTDYSYIVPTGTMVIHPVRMNGMVIGVPQTFDYFKQIQDRITGFVCSHCKISKEELESLMMETGVLTKDVGTILVGEETVQWPG